MQWIYLLTFLAPPLLSASCEQVFYNFGKEIGAKPLQFYIYTTVMKIAIPSLYYYEI